MPSEYDHSKLKWGMDGFARSTKPDQSAFQAGVTAGVMPFGDARRFIPFTEGSCFVIEDPVSAGLIFMVLEAQSRPIPTEGIRSAINAVRG